MALGERIRKARKENDISQIQLAHRLNVSQKVVSNWETNSSNPSPQAIANMCYILNVSADYLIAPQRKRKKEKPLEGLVEEGKYADFFSKFLGLDGSSQRIVKDLVNIMCRQKAKSTFDFYGDVERPVFLHYGNEDYAYVKHEMLDARRTWNGLDAITYEQMATALAVEGQFITISDLVDVFSGLLVPNKTLCISIKTVLDKFVALEEREKE